MPVGRLQALAAVGACLICTIGMAPAFAQQAIPRTSDGHPDFQGVWSTVGLTAMERMPGAAALVVNDADAARIALGAYNGIRAPTRMPDPNGLFANVGTLLRVNGEWRTSMITDPPDGKLPFTADGLRYFSEEMARQDAVDSAGYEVRPVFERCLAGTGAPPLWLVPAENIRQIVQTPDSLVLYTEEGGDLRVFGIGAAHRPSVLTSYVGDSVARWEGDVLVVETLGARNRAFPFFNNRYVVRDQSRIVERFSFVSPDEILYRFTVEDPAVYTRPWTAEFSLNRAKVRAYEFGCHEGNYSLPGILGAARIKDARKN